MYTDHRDDRQIEGNDTGREATDYSDRATAGNRWQDGSHWDDDSDYWGGGGTNYSYGADSYSHDHWNYPQYPPLSWLNSTQQFPPLAHYTTVCDGSNPGNLHPV